MERRYYSMRTPESKDLLDLATLKDVIYAVYSEFKSEGFFDRALGYPPFDFDSAPVVGTLGPDVARSVFARTRNKTLWPIEDFLPDYSESDLFTLIELLHDYIAQPLPDGAIDHGYLGVQYVEFDGSSGRLAFRNALNSHLRDYRTGYELTESGEIAELPDVGFTPLMEARVPPTSDPKVHNLVDAAVNKFRSYHSDLSARKDAIRDLCAALEMLRPKLDKTLLTKKDEAALFQIANNFELRHHNSKQHSNYDRDIWYRWIFYVYLATIHATLRSLEKPSPTRASNA